MGILYQLGIALFVVAAASAYSASSMYKYMKNQCNVAALQAENKAMSRDLSIAKSSAEEARKRTVELTEIVSSNAQEIEKYEAALKSDMVCAADDYDVALDRRLRRVTR